jgi:hypothetical protein
MFDDDGSGEVGTVLNNDWKQELYNQIDGVIASAYTALDTSVETITSSTVGTVDNLPIDATTRVHVVRFTGAADVYFTGTQTTKGSLHAGDRLIVTDTAAVGLYLKRGGSSSTPLWYPLTGFSIGLPIYGTLGIAEFVYDDNASRWTLLQHEQGGPIGIAYNAANFPCESGGTWTTTAGGQNTYAYYVQGATAHLNIDLTNSTITGAPAWLGLYGWPFTFVGEWTVGMGYPLGSGQNGMILAQTSGSNLFAYGMTPGNWFAGSGVSVRFSSTVLIQ